MRHYNGFLFVVWNESGKLRRKKSVVDAQPFTNRGARPQKIWWSRVTVVNRRQGYYAHLKISFRAAINRGQQQNQKSIVCVKVLGLANTFCGPKNTIENFLQLARRALTKRFDSSDTMAKSLFTNTILSSSRPTFTLILNHQAYRTSQARTQRWKNRQSNL